MILVPVLLAACLGAPWFDEQNTVREECGTYHSAEDANCCSDSLHWDPVSQATHYEVQRTSPGGTVLRVGVQPARTCDSYDEDAGVCLLWRETPYWIPALDCERGPHSAGCIFPRYLSPGQTYAYSVRACNADGCSAWAAPTQYARSNEWVWCDPRNSPACVLACWPGPCGAAW